MSLMDVGLPNHRATGSSGGNVSTKYTQTAVLATSGNIPIPSGTNYIEALMSGGGGGGNFAGGGGGYGGAIIASIPVVGTSIDYTIGAGGAGASGTAAASNGGTTTASINGTVYAAVGGGGGAGSGTAGAAGGYGKFSGGGGGATNTTGLGGQGGTPFSKNIIWAALDNATDTGATTYTSNSTVLPLPFGMGTLLQGSRAGMGVGGSGGGGSGAQGNGVRRRRRVQYRHRHRSRWPRRRRRPCKCNRSSWRLHGLGFFNGMGYRRSHVDWIRCWHCLWCRG